MMRFFAAHPTAANLMMLLIIAAGLLSVPDLKRETFPDFAAREVGVEVEYPGARAEDVEEAVCRRIEDALEGITDLAETRCEAAEGTARTVAEMREGADLVRFLDDVKTEVEAIDDFPAGTERPVIRELDKTDFVASVALSGPMSARHLKAYAEALKDQLLRLPEISQVDIRGFSDHQVRIEIPRLALRQHGLSVADVASTITRQSLDLPAGTIETHAQDVLIRFADERASPREFEDLVVLGAASGAEIRLGDIATITDGFADAERMVLFDGERAAVLEVRKTREEDSLRVVDAVEDFIERERRTAAPGVTLALAQDVSSIVHDRLTMLLENGVQGLVLVFLAMALFFGLRFSFWVALGLPVSFLATFFVMSVIGYSLNMITMVGLLMAIGLLMDDAIVIAENIAAHLERGKNALEAVVAGTRQVLPGVVSSFITTVCVFAPLAFLSGDIGQVLKVIPVVLIVTLAVSLVEAFLILPHHLVHPVARLQARAPSRLRETFDAGFAWVRERLLGGAVDAAVTWRYTFLGFLGLGFLASVGYVAGGHIKFQAFPDIDGDVVEARLLLPQGTPLARTQAVVGRITDGLERVNVELTPAQPGGQPLVRHVQVRFAENVDAAERGPHVATVSVDLLSAEERTVTLAELFERWRAAVGPLAGVTALTFQEFQLGPEGRALEMRLQGPDLDALKAASLALQEWLRGYHGTGDIMDDVRPGKPERRLRLREGATTLGLDASDVASQLRAAFLGEVAQEIQVGPESYEVEVGSAFADRDSLADLEEFVVTLPSGRQVPLGAVAVIEPARGWARIQRIDGQRTITVHGDVDTRVANAIDIIRDTRERFLPDLERRYPGVEVSTEGQWKEASTTGASVQSGFLFGLLGIFVILAFQFRGYLEPLAVMAAIPLALLGALWGHALLGYEISMPSLVGAASLAGVVVNDSILMVQFIKQRAGEGRPVSEAARFASRDRFRAVLLTSLTTVLGLLPLLAERSLQAQVLKPLVVSVVFGLLASTVLVLLALPALYAVLADLGSRGPAARRVTRPGPTPG